MRETGTGQQVAQLHERYMMMLMLMILLRWGWKVVKRFGERMGRTSKNTSALETKEEVGK